MSSATQHASHAAAPTNSGSSSRTALTLLDGMIGRVVEAAAALLVVAEIVVLFAGVVSRYVFHMPVVWSVELAALLFLWLLSLSAPSGSRLWPPEFARSTML
jgi:hypothetical protein